MLGSHFAEIVSYDFPSSSFEHLNFHPVMKLTVLGFKAVLGMLLRLYYEKTFMTPQVLNTVGLSFGIVGVLFIFIWGLPQPSLESGVPLGLGEKTPIKSTGKTVADHNREVAARRNRYTIMSRIGLSLIMIGFGLQLWALWAPD